MAACAHNMRSFKTTLNNHCMEVNENSRPGYVMLLLLVAAKVAVAATSAAFGLQMLLVLTMV